MATASKQERSFYLGPSFDRSRRRLAASYRQISVPSATSLATFFEAAMPAPLNSFKRAILAGQDQVGLWLALANSYTSEIAAATGFDWVLIDAEHAPNDI